jgi:cytochrome P450
LFYKNPLEFKPQRWEGKSSYNGFTRKGLIPFGFNHCPAQKQIVGDLMVNFNIKK